MHNTVFNTFDGPSSWIPITTLAMMSRPREEPLEPEVVRPRRITRPPSYLRDYDVSYSQNRLAFAEEQSEMLSCMREMREENMRLRQDVKRISELIANSPVLASQGSLSVQRPSNDDVGLSSTPKSTSNPNQPEHTPLVPSRDESLHTGHNRGGRDLIEELTESLKKVGRFNDNQSGSGMSTPSYNDPLNSKSDSPRYGNDANVPLRQHSLSDHYNRHTDDSPFGQSRMSTRDVHRTAIDPYHRCSSDRHLPDYTQRDHFDHSPFDWRQECIQESRPLPPNHSYYSQGRSELPSALCPSSMQYRGPTPKIPDFCRDDPREFARLKLALTNILPDDASESFKFQILMDHLKLEDALLVADSYSHSRTPFSDTMRALTDMYGQPHQLALQRIGNLMDGPSIRSGDVKSFKAFALRVRALVGMLNQLGSTGWTELKCGSHVSRLLAKLPYDLRANFKRFINPLQTPIPTLLDFADWLEYEVRVQVEGTQYGTYPDQEKHSSRKDKRTSFVPRKMTTVLHGGEQKVAPVENPKTTATDPDRPQDKPKKYCPFCDTVQHYMNQCSNFKLLSNEQIESWIRTGNRCWRCGRGHSSAKCTLKAKCKRCDRRHLDVLHDVNSSSEAMRKGSIKTSQKDANSMEPASQTLYLDRPASSKQVLLKLSRVILQNGDKSLETYAVLDDGSERTILLYEAAQCLGLQGEVENLALRTVRQEVHTIHGRAVSFSISPVSNPDRSYSIKGAFTAKELALVQHTYPIADLQSRYRHLRDLPLNDIHEAQPLLLIGSDYPHLITPVEPVRLGPPGGPAAVHTKLGWTLQGPSSFLNPSLHSQECLFISCLSPENELFRQVENLWKLDTLPYRSEKVVSRSRQDAEAIHLLEEKTIRIDVDGVKRYATPLLWKESPPPLNAPKEAVMAMLRSTERKLARDPSMAEAYESEIQKLLVAGYVTPLTSAEYDLSYKSWYIPHHMVQHNAKNRIVFNCSFEYQGKSLNDHLLPGPTLSSSLLGVLLRFREHPVAISSDVKGMFHQVRLLDEDKPFLRFLWRHGRTSEPAVVYQWQVLPFGTACSPCCATYALQAHAKVDLEATDEVRQTVERNFYVDNCLKSVPTEAQAVQLVNRLQCHLKEGGFELRQWASNIPEVICHLPAELKSSSSDIWLRQEMTNPQENALGLIWQCRSDTLVYKPYQKEKGETTMRNIYRTLAKLYDPLGYLIPYTTRAKSVVQLLWDKRREWDDPNLPMGLLDIWHQWESELPHLPEIHIPRCYSASLQHPVKSRSVHVFCDASEKAYGSVAYLCSEDEHDNMQVSFLAARSRVAPRKQISIARLELCAALTGAQLGDVLKKELTLDIHQFVYWSDSTTVLTWLQSDSCRYRVFVGVRVTEIQELSDPGAWRYVDSASNPADDITRGLSLVQLAEETRWKRGPDFLTKPSSCWPKVPEGQVPEENQELKKSVFCGSLKEAESQSEPDAQEFSSYSEFLEATARSLHGAAVSLSADEFQKAELSILRQCQMHDFPEEFSLLKDGKAIPAHSRLIKLAPEYDKELDLIRVGGRLRRCHGLSEEILHPIVLSPNHPVVKLLIKHYDAQLHHPGAERVFAELRRKFWILRGREAIKRHQHSCLDCKKWRGKPMVPRMADLPSSSLRLFKPPFYSTGMDCFGPLMVKVGRRTEKRWGIVYKCLTTRAVHLDLLYHMDGDSFLMSLRRFVARRGKPYELLSDQGTNFKGGAKELEHTFHQIQPSLRDQLAKEQIRFQFNPPSAPHFGGSWEREVRSVKTALRTTLGAQTVTEEVLRTVLVEVENILNSRPLGYVSSDVADPDPVTPNSLLMGRPDSSLPQVVYSDSELLSKKRWRHSQVLSDHFWKHFVHDFLPTLQSRQKWHRERQNIAVGTVVLIVDEQLPRALWKVGTVSSVIPSSDGRVRTAVVKVKDQTYTRPVVKLIELPALPPDTDSSS